MQIINIANNCKVIPKSFANIKPFRSDLTPKEKEKATERLCNAEALKEKWAKYLRENFLNRQNLLKRQMTVLFAAHVVLNGGRGV